MEREILIRPELGKLGPWQPNGFSEPPTAARWDTMSAEQLALCTASDDDRLVNSDFNPVHFFRFDVGQFRDPQSLEFYAEGHSTTGSLDSSRSLHLWNYVTLEWVFFALDPTNPYPSTDYKLQFSRAFSALESYISGDIIWFYIVARGLTPPSQTLYTDDVGLTVTDIVPGRLSTAHNLSGQRFRVFDDGDAGEVSFERLDHPSGSWSTPTQPFGAGSSSADIECLADGRLRCALIDSDGNLQQYYSSDDGESWV
ncbi:MAG TPA: hypothetical protein VMY87_01170 [Armatimonadota bacterium]|nr:hypothetical protein [Armatimonadota bacterium]